MSRRTTDIALRRPRPTDRGKFRFFDWRVVFSSPMTKRLNRRRFLKSSGLALEALGLTPGFVSAVEPFKRTGAPRLLLSLAAYSFREYFIQASHSRAHEPDPARRIDMFQFVEYCAEHCCDGAEVTR